MRPVDLARAGLTASPSGSRARRPLGLEGERTEADWLPPRSKLRRPSDYSESEGTSLRRLFGSFVGLVPKGLKAAPPPVEIDESRQAANPQWAAIRSALILDGIPTDLLAEAYRSGAISAHKLERDALLLVGDRYGVVLQGQIELGLFDPTALREEREALDAVDGAPSKDEQTRRTQRGPLVRLAKSNLCLFEEGDVFQPESASREQAYFAVTPALVILVDDDELQTWRERYTFIDDRFRRAGQLTRHKLGQAVGATGESSDFFVRHGLSVSMTLRVRRLDACFECGACEQACEDRYGVKRLSLNGRILGGLDFVDTCHTCTDARCIDPCNFDAISFDATKREVLINEAACTGCTLCSLACPYDAIEMHELDDQPLLQIRLEKQKSLGFGDGTPRKARLRRIASKCDHCVSYEDQACISACPTGALLEMLPSDVAAQLPIVVTPSKVRAAAKAGYDESVAISIDSAMSEQRRLAKRRKKSKVAVGIELPEFGRAKARRTRLAISLWWWLGSIAFLLACAEIALRKLAPAWSLAYLLETHADGIEPEIALTHIDYRAGCALAIDYGYIGTALMMTTFLYVLKRRIGFLNKLGTPQAWFDWHVMSGTIGPAFVLLHTGAKLDNWISFAVWAMIGCVLSGLFGRYLTTQLPQQYSHAPGQAAQLSADLVGIGERWPNALIADEWGDAYRRRISDAEEVWLERQDRPLRTSFAALGWLLRDDLLLRSRERALMRSLRAARVPWRVRGKVVRIASRRALLQRRRALFPMLSPLFGWWKILHVPMSITLAVVGGIHIALAWMAG
jgi:Fe-S-cluster-containing hydrogenase component 2